MRHLRVLCAIADAGSLHRAARELGVSQPSLTAQLQRVERLMGGLLFHRERSGCRPTALGRVVLCRARPLLSDMDALITEGQAEAARAGTAHLRVGSTASLVLPDWLRGLRDRRPEAQIRLQVNVSANTLLRMVASSQLDVAFVHEVEGSPLRLPAGLSQRVLVEREPQFVILPVGHPAARRKVVPLSDLADSRWMVDPAADGEWEGLRRALGTVSREQRVMLGDYHTTGLLVAAGEVVSPCQPFSSPPATTAVVRPLLGDPLGVCLLLVSRPGTDVDWIYEALETAYWEAAWNAPVYRDWLLNARGGGDGAPTGPFPGRPCAPGAAELCP